MMLLFDADSNKFPAKIVKIHYMNSIPQLPILSVILQVT